MVLLQGRLLGGLLIFSAARGVGQVASAPRESRSSMMPAAGLLSAQRGVADEEARHKCLTLPVAPPNDRLQSPHGNTLLTTRCTVSAYENLQDNSDAQQRWSDAHYKWTSVFTAEDSAVTPYARDTVTEDEVVLFEAAPHHRVRPIWHVRYDNGVYGVWRSITPEVAATRDRTTLLSVMSCVNGTGGCEQEFLERHANGQWVPVRQQWLEQLPRGYAGQIQHGVRIDPRTLRGEAGFYGGQDPNCCPSQTLIVDLALHDDSLVLQGYKLRTNP